jgi:hypothetical protein
MVFCENEKGLMAPGQEEFRQELLDTLIVIDEHFLQQTK